jgi:hypothetical protein
MGVLVLELRGVDIQFGLSVIPPFRRVGKENLPQAKPVYVYVFFFHLS